MVKELKDFLLRGNVVDLAVAVVIGAAFGLVVSGFLDAIINPLIALIFGQPSLATVGFTISDTLFPIGVLLDAILNFVIVGTVLFFVVKAAKVAMERNKEEVVVVEETPEDVMLLRQIRDSLRSVPEPPR